MTIGTVSRFQVPMIMTFDEADVEYICESLRLSLEEAYKIIDFFNFDLEEDPWSE